MKEVEGRKEVEDTRGQPSTFNLLLQPSTFFNPFTMEHRDKLIAALNDPEEAERRFAAEDLGLLGDGLAVTALIAALGDPSIAVREAAADALSAIGGTETATQVAGVLASEDAARRNLALEILGAMGQDAVPVLKECCAATSADIRKFAADTLGKIGEIAAINATPLLLGLLDDPDVNVAGAAAEALGRLGDRSVLPDLLARMDREPWMQCNILDAVARLPGEEALAALNAMDCQAFAPEVLFCHRTALHRLAGREGGAHARTDHEH